MDAELNALRARAGAAVIAAMNRACARPMQWGVDDCALWVADILCELTGADPAAEFRGRYKTQRGARRVLGKGGLAGAIRRAARRLGWVRIPAGYAEPGDLGLLMGPAGPTMVICRARGWFVGRDERGFGAVAARHVRLAWSLDRDWSRPGARVSFPRISGRPQFVGSSVVCHEPISTIIGLTALIEGLGASAAVAGAIGGAIVGGAISVGLSLAASLLIPKPGGGGAIGELGGSSVNSPDIRYTERQSIPSKRIIFGAAYVGGALFFEQVKPPFLYMGLLLNEGEIAGVDTIWVGTNQLLFSRIDFNTILAPLFVAGQPNYPTRLQVSLRPGTTTQALDLILSTDFTPLNANFLQKGIATAVFRYHYGTDYTEFTKLWGQVQRPSSFLLVRGIKVYDPRDASQRVDDETTWKWSNNASLIQAFYLTRDYGGRISPSNVLWKKVALAADYDDEMVACKDGTFIKRHTIDGVVTLNQKPSDVMSAMLTANGGRIAQSGGKYWVTSSRPRSPIATIHDAILAGAIEVRGAKPKADMINKLQARFVAQEQDYQLVDLPVLERTDLEAADGEVLTATIELPFTLDYRRAERLQKQALERSRLGKQVSVTVDITLLADLDDDPTGNVFTVASDLFPSANGDLICDAFSFADDCTTVGLVLSEYNPAIENDWNPAVDERDFVVANPFTL